MSKRAVGSAALRGLLAGAGFVALAGALAAAQAQVPDAPPRDAVPFAAAPPGSPPPITGFPTSSRPTGAVVLNQPGASSSLPAASGAPLMTLPQPVSPQAGAPTSGQTGGPAGGQAAGVQPGAPSGAASLEGSGRATAGAPVQSASMSLPGAGVPTPSVAAASMPKPPPLVPAPPPNASQQALITTGLASVTVRPGETNIFPVSAGRVNRIVTPFTHAKVRSETPGGVEVEGGAIYFTPTGTDPVSMFITEDRNETVAISVTLVPSRMPPVHLELRLPGEIAGQIAARQGVDRSQAEAFERGHPFVDVVRTLMRALALGRVPNGYELQPTIPAAISLPRCAASPVQVDFSRGQYLLGGTIEVLVGLVSNPGAVGLDFTESWCGGSSVLAVALSPTPYLAPHGLSEIYVARRLAATPDEHAQQRPSLLGGGG
jgi:conjugal transfer pilus assembly protein TraK